MLGGRRLQISGPDDVILVALAVPGCVGLGTLNVPAF